MILKDSRPKIIDNVIINNDRIGLFVRDKSHGEILLNKVRDDSFSYFRLIVIKSNLLLREEMRNQKISSKIMKSAEISEFLKIMIAIYFEDYNSY